MSAMHAAALKLAAQGRAVFPLLPGAKVPLIPKEDGGNGFHDATTETSVIDAWWTACPEANIGMATGAASRVSVVDVDIKEWENKHGDETLRTLTKKYGALPETLTQRTWSGGLQIVFAYRPGASNAAGGYGKWIDGKNDGGYVVVAPSIVNGCEYKWVDANAPLAEMPEWLFKIGAKSATNGHAPAKTVKEMAGDGRNNALTSLAG